jgi:hypothetical protein
MNELRFAFKRESEWSPATRTPSPTPWGDSVRFYVCGSPVVFLPSDQPVGAFVCSAGDPGSPLRRLPAGPSFWQRMAASTSRFHVYASTLGFHRSGNLPRLRRELYSASGKC